jgi:NTF2 fold immunity protein
MKIQSFFIGWVFSLAFMSCSNTQMKNSTGRYRGPIPDSAAAITIAEMELASKYGIEEMKHQRPYHAFLREDVWIIYGSLSPAPKGWMRVGGVAEVRISKKTGRILSVVQEE